MCCSIVILGTIDSRNAWIGRWSWLEGFSWRIGTLPIIGACVAWLGLCGQQIWSVGPEEVSCMARLGLCGQQLWSVGPVEVANPSLAKSKLEGLRVSRNPRAILVLVY